jgi:hypothetical protein
MIDAMDGSVGYDAVIVCTSTPQQVGADHVNWCRTRHGAFAVHRTCTPDHRTACRTRITTHPTSWCAPPVAASHPEDVATRPRVDSTH